MAHRSEVVALLEERRGYVLRGLTARVAQVDARLATYGVVATEETAAVEHATEKAESPVRKRRRLVHNGDN